MLFGYAHAHSQSRGIVKFITSTLVKSFTIEHVFDCDLIHKSICEIYHKLDCDRIHKLRWLCEYVKFFTIKMLSYFCYPVKGKT